LEIIAQSFPESNGPGFRDNDGQYAAGAAAPIPVNMDPIATKADTAPDINTLRRKIILGFFANPETSSDKSSLPFAY
jgi:hypothetical protein